MKKRRKMRKQPTKALYMHDFDAEPGDRVYDEQGKIYDLRVSSGWGKREAGELTPILARPQETGAEAVQINGVWYWEREV